MQMFDSRFMHNICNMNHRNFSGPENMDIRDIETKGKGERQYWGKRARERKTREIDNRDRVRESKYPQFRSSGKWMSSRLLGRLAIDLT